MTTRFQLNEFSKIIELKFYIDENESVIDKLAKPESANDFSKYVLIYYHSLKECIIEELLEGLKLTLYFFCEPRSCNTVIKKMIEEDLIEINADSEMLKLKQIMIDLVSNYFIFHPVLKILNKPEQL